MEAATRQIKLETIRRSIEESSSLSLPANREKVISQCSKMWGTRRQAALELINELITDEAIYMFGNDLWSYERGEKIIEAEKRDYSNPDKQEVLM